jgi:putative acetyltransferase
MNAAMPIRRAQPSDAEQLFEIWLEAVRATHLFLAEEEVQALVPFVRQYLAEGWESLWILEVDGAPVGFMGLAGREIESLFIAPAHHRQGGGRLLVAHAKQMVDGALTVSVNEQNPGACRFYEACGFQAVGRSETDSAGRPYPLVHLRMAAAGDE